MIPALFITFALTFTHGIHGVFASTYMPQSTATKAYYVISALLAGVSFGGLFTLILITTA